MRKVNYEKGWEPADLLKIKVNRYAYEVQEKLGNYNISVQVSSEQVEKLLNDVIDVEIEEVEKEEVTRGSISVRKGGAGKYYSVKNIHLRLSDFLELVFNLYQGDIKSKLIISFIFLFRLMVQLGVDLEEEQTMVCVALYNITKRYTVTDDDVIKYIVGELRESYYIELDKNKIGNILSELIKMGLVSVEEGRYELTQKIVFN